MNITVTLVYERRIRAAERSATSDRGAVMTPPSPLMLVAWAAFLAMAVGLDRLEHSLRKKGNADARQEG